jgi:hypothetical protein
MWKHVLRHGVAVGVGCMGGLLARKAIEQDAEWLPGWAVAMIVGVTAGVVWGVVVGWCENDRERSRR